MAISNSVKKNKIPVYQPGIATPKINNNPNRLMPTARPNVMVMPAKSRSRLPSAQMLPNGWGTGVATANELYAMGWGRTPYEKLTNEYQKAYDSAVSANESRYADILGQYGNLSNELVSGYQSRLDKSMGMLEGLGSQEAADIEQQWINAKSRGQQNLLDRGFANTTVMPTMEMGYERNKRADLSRLNERLQNQRLGIYGDMSADVLSARSAAEGAKLGFMERREDTYPDINMYSRLAEMAGMAGLSNSNGSYGYLNPAMTPAAYQPYSPKTISMKPRQTQWVNTRNRDRINPKLNNSSGTGLTRNPSRFRRS